MRTKLLLRLQPTSYQLLSTDHQMNQVKTLREFSTKCKHAELHFQQMLHDVI